jgi:hypothetical protein
MASQTAPPIVRSLPRRRTSFEKSVTNEKRMTFFTSRINALTTERQKFVPYIAVSMYAMWPRNRMNRSTQPMTTLRQLPRNWMTLFSGDCAWICVMV